MLRTAADTDLRTFRQAAIDARVAGLRTDADRIEAQADRLLGQGIADRAAAGPAHQTATGRSLSRRRDTDRSAYLRAGSLVGQAKELRGRADTMERRGAVVVGDAAAQSKTKADAVQVTIGQTVRTIHYGLRKVLKVNRLSILVEGSFGPLKVEKQFILAA